MTRLIKEVRTLGWPAIAILAATILPVAGENGGEAGALGGWSVRIAMVACFLGTALLVALPFGAEFQQHTLVLLLSQPVTRTRVWMEKGAALLTVLVVVTFVQYLTVPDKTLTAHSEERVLVFLALMACSGPIWTLCARSTIGGAAFSLAGLLLVEMGASLAVRYTTGTELALFANHPAMVIVRMAYAGLTAWLGWRTFAHYEATGSSGGVGSHFIGSVPGFQILRSRPQGAFVNLVRKEVRLQQPTFLIAGLFAGCWLAALLVLMASPRPQIADVVLTVLVASYMPLSLIIAATISVGEETSLGVHAWHLTYPVAPAVQCWIKFGVATAVVALLGLALPLGLVAVAPFAVALPAGELQLPALSTTVLLAAGILLIGFWASTLVRHTVRAAVTTAVAIGVLALVTAVGGWIGMRLGIGTELLTSLMGTLQLRPDALHPFALGLTNRRFEWLASVVALVVVGTLALRQSLAAFGTARIDRGRIVRSSAQLAIVAMLTAFFPTAYIKAAGEQYRSLPVRELTAALQHVSAASIAASGEVPTAVSASELETTELLSEQTRRWLAGSQVFLRASKLRKQAAGDVTYVSARVTFPNGREFRMLFSVR
jgi:hypothetical protein